jgi:hypothetical protein
VAFEKPIQRNRAVCEITGKGDAQAKESFHNPDQG